MRLALGLLFLILACLTAAAQELSPARQALEEGRFVRARELAEAALEKDPDSPEALFVLGRVYYDAEGSLPRAYYFLSQAEKLMEKGELHQEVLALLAFTTHDMERYEEALEWIERHDKLYQPPIEAHAGWALMKLGRLEEARERMKAVVAGDDVDARITALNTLGALEWEMGNLRESRDYFVQIVMLYRQAQVTPDVTFLWNKAESELALGDARQAERDLLEAVQAFSPDTYSNPYTYLALIYADQARFPEAVAAVREMLRWNAGLAPAVANQKWTTVQSRVAAVLLACGYDEAARNLMERVLQRPDRNAATSDHPYLEESRTLMLYQEALKLVLARQDEARSWSSGREWWALSAGSWADLRRLGAARTRAGALIAGNGGLARALQAYQVSWVVPPWLLPDSIDVFGSGVVAAEVNRLLASHEWEEQHPVLEACLAEARLRQGATREALEEAEKALKGLPESQTLLRTRVRAVQGEALHRLGRTTEACQAFGQVLDVDPSAFRRLGLALPVSFESSGGSTLEKVESMLRRSPRLRSAEEGFAIRLAESGGRVEARLLSPQGGVLALAASPDRGDALETARALCRSFHEVTFAPRVDLSQTDINSLDGSTAASSAARERIIEGLGL